MKSFKLKVFTYAIASLVFGFVAIVLFQAWLEAPIILQLGNGFIFCQ